MADTIVPVPTPSGVPPELGIGGPRVRWFQEPIGGSGAEVFLVTEPGRPDRYLKCDPRVAERRLAAERDRMAWLKGRLPVPEVLGYAVTTAKEWLVSSAIPGLCACDPHLAMPRRDVVRIMAHELRCIHALPADGCPFVRRLADKLADDSAVAATRDAECQAEWSAFLARSRPPEDLVFVHGDYCEPNIMFEDGRLSGFIDLGYAGISDRYSDFCQAAYTLNRNGDAALIPFFFAEYGLAGFDQAKLEYYQTMEMFFG
ncbi:MAG: aminoglycoside 3'-phosphotransferase [Candidatus Coatesbacteria bacterium]